MMVLVMLINILGFKSYIHNNYLFFFRLWYMHMSSESFKCLLNVVGPMMTKRHKVS